MMTAALALSLVAGLASQPGGTPGDSLYDPEVLDAQFLDQRGVRTRLSAHEGHPVLLAMFYATCPSACPRLIADVQRVLAQLDERTRNDVRVVLVSLNPKHDTPQVLAGVMEGRGLDRERTTLLVGAEEDTRRLAVLLGVRYRDDGQGTIDHSSRIVVLDRGGRIVNKRDGLGGSVDGVAEALRTMRAR